MAETKWTPGPWNDAGSVAEGDEGRWHVLLGDRADVVVRGERTEANARLLAAAPDLYEAASLARSIIAEIHGNPDAPYNGAAHRALNALADALARARGEEV